MRKLLSLLMLTLFCSLLIGCPRNNLQRYRYTSADLQGGRSSLGPLFDAAAGGGGEGAPTVERAVVEPDVIRQDGGLLYILNQYRGLTLVDLETETVLSQVPTLGYPRDLYLNGNRAYVLVSYAADYEVNGDTVSYDIASRLYVVDVADPEDLEVVGSFELEGDLVDSRLVGDVLYAVTAEYDWYWMEGAVAVTKVKTSGSRIAGINVGNEDHIYLADAISLEDIGDVVQATPDAIFVAGRNGSTGKTRITYVDISDPSGLLTVRDTVGITGFVADKFKMDAYNGVLRVVSSAWNDQSQVFVTTIDLANPDNLVVLAETEFESARGDTLFATRFDGPRAYIVTYFIVDPLYVVDLSDPTNPVVAGELEVPGWSTHIEPRGDRLIALGVDDTNGRKVSVSLFNVADPANPSLVKRVSFGQDWNWSSAYGDVKAFTVLDDTLIVPFSGWEEIGGGFDRLQFLSWSASDLQKRGTVDVQGGVLRSFEYNDTFYCVTTEQLATIDGTDLDAPVVTNRVILADNVADFVELSASVGVEILTHYDTGKTTLRAVSLPLKGVLGEITVETGELVDAYRYAGSKVVLIGATWSNTPSYVIKVIDFANPGNPEPVGSRGVNVTPYHGYWWIMPYEVGGGGGVSSWFSGGAAVSTAVYDIAIWPWFPTHDQRTTMLVGDTLVLRCTANSYNQVIGSDAPHQGIALVDLPTLDWTATVGLGFDDVSSVDSAGSKVYVSSKTYLNNTNPFAGKPLCAYFVTEFDPASRNAGPTVNVPGSLVQYNPSSDVLTLRDDQWNNDYTYRSVLRTVSWDGGSSVTPLDDVNLPNGAGVVIGRGARVFIEAYNNGTRLYAATVNGGGGIQLSQGTLVTEEWGSLIDGNGTSAYLTIGGGAIARYNCNGKPALEELVEVMGSPAKMRFGNSAAYAPLGYFGIVQMGL